MTHKTSSKGFTLIETLIAIAIIMIAITGPFAATESSIHAVAIAHDKSVATFLAQEGIEYIHAIRDKVYIKECFSSSGANCNNWWKVFTTGRPGYDVLQCLGGTPCALDMTRSQYVYDNTSPFTSRALSSCTPGTGGLNGICDQLYLTPTYSYTTSSAAGNTPTIFSRKIVTTPLGSHAIKVKVTVTWGWHGSTQSITATDVLTSWLHIP